MKIKDLINNTYITNEEATVMKKIDDASPLKGFSERDQFIMNSLIRKNLISKIRNGSTVMVVKNGTSS
jgi:hypothetical protein|tara:strand:- start:941 stop:1144 length:204 start_codon:yes stop_codon:yes gene_type:complete